MNTLTRISSLLLLVCVILISAQNISFENINSNNVLALIPQIQNTSDSQNNTDIKSLQYGNQNYTEIQANSQTSLSTMQIGDYNYLNFDNSFEKNSVKSAITTQGNNNIIDITGSNSISEKIQIHVKGDNMTLFMRNY